MRPTWAQSPASHKVPQVLPSDPWVQSQEWALNTTGCDSKTKNRKKKEKLSCFTHSNSNNKIPPLKRGEQQAGQTRPREAICNRLFSGPFPLQCRSWPAVPLGSGPISDHLCSVQAPLHSLLLTVLATSFVTMLENVWDFNAVISFLQEEKQTSSLTCY